METMAGKKHHRLKEPTSAEVEESVCKVLKVAAQVVLDDHQNDVLPAEHVQLVKMYLTRAMEALADRQRGKELLAKLVTPPNHVKGNETIH